MILIGGNPVYASWAQLVSGAPALDSPGGFIPQYALVNRDGQEIFTRDGQNIIVDPTERTS